MAIAEVQPIQRSAVSREEQARRLSRIRRNVQVRYVLLALPALAFLIVFYGYPVAAMLLRAFNDPTWGTENFEPLTRVRSHFDFLLFSIPSNAYIRVLWTTVTVAVVVTVVTLLLAYPVAYLLSSVRTSVASILMIFVLIPFWTSILIRSYSWMVLLGREGLINKLITSAGIRDEPMQLLNTRFAVYVAMIHILLPFMILPLYSVMRGIDRNLMRAAENLGAPPATVFRRVFLPLSLPGIGAGCLLVFILGLGFYITPALLGGRRDVMISMLIQQQVQQINWGFASALALLLLAVALAVYTAFTRLLGVERLYGGGRS
jgi:ABC-type spermidine/putrescine transport system permease subunit I